MADGVKEEKPSGASTGRPKSDINPAEVKFPIAKGFSISKISSLLGVSR